MQLPLVGCTDKGGVGPSEPKGWGATRQKLEPQNTCLVESGVQEDRQLLLVKPQDAEGEEETTRHASAPHSHCTQASYWLNSAGSHVILGAWK